ncbi:hypothetical protein GMMP13_390008 [Candidatus Magnetomoraceae bacterium gMMP-13]
MKKYIELKLVATLNKFMPEGAAKFSIALGSKIEDEAEKEDLQQ